MTKLDPHDITDRNLHPHSVPHEVTGCRLAAEKQSSSSSFRELECFPMHRMCGLIPEQPWRLTGAPQPGEGKHHISMWLYNPYCG